MEEMFLKNKTYEVKKQLGDKTYKVTRNNKNFIIKKFSDLSDLEKYVENHKTITKSGVFTAKIRKIDKKNLLVLQDFIEGKNLIEYVADQSISDEIYRALFMNWQFARFNKKDIDHKPENYIYGKKYVYYTSNFIEPYVDETKLLDDELYYYIYSAKGITHLKEFGYTVDSKKMLDPGQTKKAIVLLSIKYW